MSTISVPDGATAAEAPCNACRHPYSQHRPSGAQVGCNGDYFRCACLQFQDVPTTAQIAKAHVETTWCCVACGRENLVWGVADQWIECEYCRADNYLI